MNEFNGALAKLNKELHVTAPLRRVLFVAVLYSVFATMLISLVSRILRHYYFDSGSNFFAAMQLLVPAGLAVFVGIKELNAPYKVLLAATAVWYLVFEFSAFAFSGVIPGFRLKLVVSYFSGATLIYLVQLPVLFAARKWHQCANPSLHGALHDKTAQRP